MSGIISPYFLGRPRQFLALKSFLTPLLSCSKNGVAALPFHDCVMVAESTSGTARKVMEDAFESATGAKPVIQKTRCDLPRVERAA